MNRRRLIAAGAVTLAVGGGVAAAVTLGGSDGTASNDRAGGKPTFVVRTKGGWTIVRNGPGGLAIGNARNGWKMVGRDKATYGYVVGFLTGTGDFAQCAWADRKNLVKVGPERDGGCDWLRFSRKFLSRINCQGCSGGTPVNLIRATGEYANYSKRFGLRDRLRGVPPGRCVEWRWVSKAGGVVMVKDRRYVNSAGSWVFVRRSALPEELPMRMSGSCPAGYHRKKPTKVFKGTAEPAG